MVKIPKFFKSFYFIVFFLFFIWMLFVDSNDLLSQYKLRSKLSELEKEQKYYKEMIDEVTVERDALFQHEELLEKFAREKYFMKRKTEDVFVIVKDE